jgi:hypothetical protein
MPGYSLGKTTDNGVAALAAFEANVLDPAIANR